MIRIAHLTDAAEAAPVLRILRDKLDDSTFTKRLSAAVAQGYKVIAAYQGDEMIGALGYRITHDLCWGQTLFVDDLVVAPDRRSSGAGGALLAEARKVASDGCDRLRLCSGLWREDAHRFYETNGLEKFSYQFVEAIGG